MLNKAGAVRQDADVRSSLKAEIAQLTSDIGKPVNLKSSIVQLQPMEEPVFDESVIYSIRSTVFMQLKNQPVYYFYNSILPCIPILLLTLSL